MECTGNYEGTINRREMLLGGAALVGGAALGAPARAAIARAFDQDLWPPIDGRDAYVAWMKDNRGEDAGFLGQRWDRYLQLISHNDVWDRADKRAFLMTPREEFVTAENLVARLRVALSQHRLRRHHHRPAHGGADDQHAGGQAAATRCSRSAPARATSRLI